MKFVYLLLAGLMLAPVASLAGETPAAAPAAVPAAATDAHPHWVACKDDVQKFCANVERGKGKIRECLSGHTADLSDACKARLAEPPHKPN